MTSQGELAVPLTRATVTAASRVMLPAYVALFAIIGVSYMTTPGQRLLESPALEYASRVLSMPVWGAMFLAASAVMVAALLRQERFWFRFALWLGIVCLAVWSALFILAAIWSNASPSAWVWPAFAAVACFASDRSLLKGEVS